MLFKKQKFLTSICKQLLTWEEETASSALEETKSENKIDRNCEQLAEDLSQVRPHCPMKEVQTFPRSPSFLMSRSKLAELLEWTKRKNREESLKKHFSTLVCLLQPLNLFIYILFTYHDYSKMFYSQYYKVTTINTWDTFMKTSINSKLYIHNLRSSKKCQISKTKKQNVIKQLRYLPLYK